MASSCLVCIQSRRLSIFSSKHEQQRRRYCLPRLPDRRRHGGAAVLRRLIGPGGAWALTLLVAIHVTLNTIVFPDPPAREVLRQKIRTLTAGTPPRVIVAGDSRALSHVDPRVVASQLDLPAEDVVNIAINGCGPSCALAGYREFAGAFADRPVMILSVSFFEVNDRADPVDVELL